MPFQTTSISLGKSTKMVYTINTGAFTAPNIDKGNR